tara:strand:+ start:88 stop:399 length:312 start_codon:yes stop_codon:yes gene_type:complete
MKLPFINNVKLAKEHPGWVGGGRIGTLHLGLSDFEEGFGAPHELDNDKVTKVWYFNTPRGLCRVYDYWWNGSNALSIGGPRDISARWLIGYLKAKGYKAEMDY